MRLFKKKYTEKELIDFGNYLLSKERYNRFKYAEGHDRATLKDRVGVVHHADVMNFKTNERLKQAVDGIIIVKPRLIKRFGFVILCLIFIGCNRSSKNIETITYKSCEGYFGEVYLKGWCRYGTSFENNFEDSCHFYSYGDTIK